MIAAGCTPFGGFDGEPTGVAPSGELLARGDSIASVLTESGALSSHPAFRAGRARGAHRRARTDHDTYDWCESAVVGMDRVPEDLVALLDPELIPEHDFHHLRPARVRTTRTPD